MKGRVPRDLWASAAVLLVVLLCAATLPGAVAAQGAAPIEVIAVEHVMAGQVHVAIRVERPEAFDASRVQARVDGLLIPGISVETLPRVNTAVVLAVDTSGSMQGAPIEAARRALLDFLALVPQEHPIALVTFADRAQTVVPFTSNRARLIEAIGRLQAFGNTSLYDAVVASAQLVRESDAGRRQIVLLSDGLDSGGTSLSSRESSVAVAQQSGAQFIAVGLGSQVDADYLGTLAAATGGATRLLTNEQSLGDVFRAHGGRLGATHSVSVPTGVIAPGPHRVTIEASVNGRALSMTRDFTVSNEGLLRLQLDRDRSSPEQRVLALQAAAPLDGLEIRATAGTTPLPVMAQGQRILVDHWALSPGKHEVSVTAVRAGTVVARSGISIDVPELAPRIEVQRADARAIVTWAAQPTTPPLAVRVLADGEEYAYYETAIPGMALELPRKGEVEVQLLGDGVVLARTQVEATSAAIPSAAWVAASVAASLGLVVIGMVRVRRRRRSAAEQARPLRLRRRPGVRGTPSTEHANAPATLVIEGARGARLFALQQRPLTLGSAGDCDVVIAEAAVRPLHARVALMPDGGVRIHTLQGPASHPTHGWARLTPGESIQIGSQTVRLERERPA